MSQPATKPSKSKKKRKKSAATSPANTDAIKSKKTRLIPADVETDTEYLSATEYSVNPHSSIMDMSQQPPITAYTTSGNKTTEGAKFVLSEADREDIAQRVRRGIDDREEIAQRVRAVLKDDITELIQQFTKPLKDELHETKKLLTLEMEKNEKLSSDVSDLKLAIDEQEQYSRRSCLRINGVIGDEGIPNENVEVKLLTLAENHNIDIKPDDIDVAHRVGKPRPGFTRSVIVKFSNTKARQRVLGARKTLGNVYVNEDLTRFRQSLHYHARVLVREKRLDHTWVAGAKIYCSYVSSPGVKVHIRSMEDIENIRNGIPLTPPRNQQ